MKDLKTVGDLFEQAILCERTAKAVYSQLTQMFPDTLDASIIFDDLARDEERHAMELEMVRDGLSEVELGSSADPEMTKKLKEMGDLSVRKLLAPVNNLNDAYELAHELEYSEINKVFEVLAMKAVPTETQKSFVLAEIRQHFAKLDVLANRFPNCEARMRIAVKCRPVT